ncbi:MAG TPA: DUF4129 domain-containing protein, partial [Acidimicrobiales bacterium]|nr:DUF4129 domain-containing protein [Acidimicrobiales bacterium]
RGARRSWADSSLSRLEDVGVARGRPRRPSETASEYAAALGRTVGDERLEQAAAVMTRDAFSGAPAGEAERQAVDRILEEAGTTT